MQAQYSYSDVAHDFSIVAELRLYCDGQTDRTFIQSSVSIGAILGLLVVNYVSDNRGRKVALLLVQSVAILGTAGIFC